MVQLRSCYFCGTAEAVTEYETLPKALRGHGHSQRVALCDSCQTKLTTVLSPVVAALDNNSAPSDVQGETGFVSDGDSTSDRSTTSTDESPTQADVTFTAGEADDAFPTATDEDDDSPSTASDADVEEVTSTDDEDAVATDTEDESAATAGESAAPVDEPVEDADTDSETHAEADTRTHTHTVGSVNAGGAGTGDELDVVYHKLLRFLRNRAFPISRTEAEGVAQSAYDLSASDASTVIQRAVDRGVLEERGGDLHRE